MSLEMEDQVNPLERDHFLSVVLPGGTEKNATVHGSTPVMDLLVTLCATYHLNPSDYTVEVLSPNKNNISFKPNSPIGSLDADKIVLKPRLVEEKTTRRPYMPEATVRLLINYNRSHKAVVRVNPRLPLDALLPAMCDKCEFQVESTILLRDSQSDEPLDLTKTLNDLGLREVFARDTAWKEPAEHGLRAKTPEAAELIAPPALTQDLPRKEKKQKENTGFLSLFRRNKKKPGKGEAVSAPTSPGLSKQVAVSMNERDVCSSSSNTLQADMPKKRRAPQPPMGVSQSVPNNLSTCHLREPPRSAESTLRSTKRRAPPPPCANTPLELQPNTRVTGTLDFVNTAEERRESDESHSVHLSLSASSSPHPSQTRSSSSSSRPSLDSYLPSFRGRDLSDARCALAKVLTSSVSKGTLVKRLKNSATFPKLSGGGGSFLSANHMRPENNRGFCAELESVIKSDLPTAAEWEDPLQRKGTTTFKVIPLKRQTFHDPDPVSEEVSDQNQVPDQCRVTEEVSGQNQVPDQCRVTEEVSGQNQVTGDVPDQYQETLDVPYQNQITEEVLDQNQVPDQYRVTEEVSDQNQVPEQYRVTEEVSDQNQVTGDVPDQCQETLDVPDQYRVTEEVPDQNRVNEEVSDQNQVTGDVPDQCQETLDVPDQYRVTEEVPDQNRVNEEVSDQNQITEEVSDQNQITEEVSDQNQITEEVSDQNQITEEVSDQNQITEEVPDQNRVNEEVSDQCEVTMDVQDQYQVPDQNQITGDDPDQYQVPDQNQNQVRVEDEPESEACLEAEEKTSPPDGPDAETSPPGQELQESEGLDSPPAPRQEGPGSPHSEGGGNKEEDEDEGQKEEEGEHEPEGTNKESSAGPSDNSDGQINSEDQSKLLQSPGEPPVSTDTEETEVIQEEEDEESFPPPPPPVFFPEDIEVMDEEYMNTSSGPVSDNCQAESTSAAASEPPLPPPPPPPPAVTAAAPTLRDRMSAGPSRFAQAVAMAVQRSRLQSRGKSFNPQAPSAPHDPLPSPPPISTYQYGA